MAKGSKKYAGHEYSFTTPAKSGLGQGLDKQKSSAHSKRPLDRGFYSAKKMADGGTTSGSPTPAPSATNSALSAMGQAVSHPQQAVGGSIISKLMGKAKGGDVKKHDAKNLKELDGSMRKFFKEEAQEKARGGEVKKKEDNRKDIGDDNKAGSVYELSSSYKKGGEIKAQNKEQKAKVKGDSTKNDKIPILASEGEFVLKRSIMKSKDAPKKAAEAVKQAKDKKK